MNAPASWTVVVLYRFCRERDKPANETSHLVLPPIGQSARGLSHSKTWRTSITHAHDH